MKGVQINPDYLNAPIERQAIDLSGLEIEILKPFARYNSMEDAVEDRNRVPVYVEYEE